MTGLDHTDWVDIDQSYELTCILDQVDTLYRIYWVVNDVLQEGTHTEVTPPGTGGMKTLTGTWTHTFTRNQGVQDLKCRVTDWDNISHNITEAMYKTVNVYCEY